MTEPIYSKSRFFYGWRIVAAGFVLLFLFAGAGFYSFSIFIKPLEDEFGWPRASIALTMSIYFIIGGCAGPLVGKLIQVYEEKRIMLISAVGAGACYMLVSLTRSLGYFYAVYAFLALMSCGMGVLPVSSLLAKWFDKRRGTATGLAMVGISAGGLILAPVMGKITLYMGWKFAYVFIGLLVWILAIPLVLFVIKDSPSELGLITDGAAADINQDEQISHHTATPVLPVADHEWTMGEMLRSRAFWWIVASFFLAPMAQMGVLQHQVPIIAAKGISQATAATALGLIAGIGGLGKVSFGRISEMLPFQWAVVICFGLQALAVFMLLYFQAIAVVWIYVVIFGFAMGGLVVLMPLTVGHFFGLGGFGLILGSIWMVQALGGALGTYSAGLIYDAFGDYQFAFYVFIAAYIIAIIAIFMAGKPDPLKGQPTEPVVPVAR
jgi:sugar phosphate permease